MEKEILKTLEITNKFIFRNMENLSQFTIDEVSEFQEQIEDVVDGDSETDIETLAGAISYRIENILQIIKSGEDQKLFKSLYDQIQEDRKDI